DSLARIVEQDTDLRQVDVRTTHQLVTEVATREALDGQARVEGVHAGIGHHLRVSREVGPGVDAGHEAHVRDQHELPGQTRSYRGGGGERALRTPLRPAPQ